MVVAFRSGAAVGAARADGGIEEGGPDLAAATVLGFAARSGKTQHRGHYVRRRRT
jgi:hypothetical protein